MNSLHRFLTRTPISLGPYECINSERNKFKIKFEKVTHQTGNEHNALSHEILQTLKIFSSSGKRNPKLPMIPQQTISYKVWSLLASQGIGTNRTYHLYPSTLLLDSKLSKKSFEIIEHKGSTSLSYSKRHGFPCTWKLKSIIKFSYCQILQTANANKDQPSTYNFISIRWSKFTKRQYNTHDAPGNIMISYTWCIGSQDSYNSISLMEG